MQVSGLGDAPVPNFERYARLTAETLGVPMALVTIVEDDRQVFPGAFGLPADVEAERSTPLSHSFCRYVVKDALPLVIDDARRDERLSDNPAIDELGVVAYAGFPLTGSDGHTVGALCAVDHRPRVWTDDELARLDDLAHLCSREIVLHEMTQHAADLEHRTQEVSGRTQLLLELSELLSDTLTLADVGSAVARAATLGLGCRRAGVWFRPDRNKPALHGVLDPPGREWAGRHAQVSLRQDCVVSRVYRSGHAIYCPDRESVRAAQGVFDDVDAAAAVPLLVSGDPIGVLVLTWDSPNRFATADRAILSALAVYTAQAVHRASLLDERMGAASTMQRALLTPLPTAPGLDLGARYRTAAANDQVGGDWYDATVLGDGSVTLMIGDVVGHDIRAAAAMGQLRSMLRALGWALDDPPSVNVGRLDRAAKDLSVSSLASLVYARLDPPDATTGRRRLRWTNAGHLPPLLVDAAGHSRLLDDGRAADMILGVLPDVERRDQDTVLEPGDTVLFFTDGLIERRDDSIDAGVQRLREALERQHARPVEELLDALLDEVVGISHADDLAVLAVRLR